VRKIIEGGAKYTAVDAYRAMYRLEELRLLADRQLEDVDVLLLPTTGTIYTHEQLAKDPVQLNTNLGYYTNFVNLLDMAALAIPAGFRSNGLPFGVTLMAASSPMPP
jgi:allophanate hydrolase